MFHTSAARFNVTENLVIKFWETRPKRCWSVLGIYRNERTGRPVWQTTLQIPNTSSQNTRTVSQQHSTSVSCQLTSAPAGRREDITDLKLDWTIASCHKALIKEQNSAEGANVQKEAYNGVIAG